MDAMMHKKGKSENFTHVFRFINLGLLQFYPPYKNLVPRFVEQERVKVVTTVFNDLLVVD